MRETGSKSVTKRSTNLIEQTYDLESHKMYGYSSNSLNSSQKYS